MVDEQMPPNQCFVKRPHLSGHLHIAAYEIGREIVTLVEDDPLDVGEGKPGKKLSIDAGHRNDFKIPPQERGRVGAKRRSGETS